MIFHFWRMNLFCFWPWVARPCDVFYKKCILLHMKCSNVMYVFRIISAISRQFQTPSHVASGTCLLLCLLSMLKLLHSRFKYFIKFVCLFVCLGHLSSISFWNFTTISDTFTRLLWHVLVIVFVVHAKALTHNGIRCFMKLYHFWFI